MPVNNTIPLVVDLNGALIQTDLLYASLCALLKQRPWCLFLLPLWLLKGKAYLKRQIAQHLTFEVSRLPYHTAFLDHLTTQHTHGRRLMLATASDARLAREVAKHLGIFETVLASDGMTNLAAERKRDRLVALFGIKGFDYAGNSHRDLAVWSAARQETVVNSLALVKRYAELVVISQEIGETTARERDYRIDDRELLTAMGVASGYLSVVVFALYLTRDPARTIFGRHDVIWLWCPLLLYWISYVWLVAHRGYVRRPRGVCPQGLYQPW